MVMLCKMTRIMTKIGSDIITQARIFVEQLGRSFELDTYSAW